MGSRQIGRFGIIDAIRRLEIDWTCKTGSASYTVLVCPLPEGAATPGPKNIQVDPL
jgi:hypothetical protein